MLATHVFTRQTQVVTSCARNVKNFVVLPPANSVTTLTNFITTLVGTDGYVEKSGKAYLIRVSAMYEFMSTGAPLDVRIYWLTPRSNPATAHCGGVPASASGILSLLTADDTVYGQALSLGTSLQNTLFDSPSVVRNYKIVKVTKWHRLDNVKNKTWKVTSTAHIPKVLDAGADKLSTLWLYLPGSMIPVVEFKGFMGTDTNQFVTRQVVPNTNAPLVAYDIDQVGKIQTDTTATHMTNSKCTMMIRTTSRGDLKLMSDETREVSNVLDVTPADTNPIYIAPLMASYAVT